MNNSCGIKWYNDSEVYNGEHVGLLNCWKPSGKFVYYFLVLHRENSTFGLQSEYVCSVWFLQWKSTTSLNIINRLIFVMDMDCVLFEVGLKFL